MSVFASAALFALLAQAGGTIEGHAEAAATAMASGNYASAERHNRAIVRLQPQMAEAHVNLGLSLFLQAKYAEATPEFRTGLRLKPQLANAKLFLGISEFKLNRASVALPLLREYSSQRPADFEGQYYLGLSYLALERYSEAETALLAARKLDGKNTDVLYHLTQSYLGQARQDPAKRDSLARRYTGAVEQIAAIEPDSYRLAQLRAGFFEADGKKADAIRELESLVQRNPRARGIHYTLGCLYTEARDYPKALQQFQAELRLDSPYPRTYLQIGHVLVAMEQPAEAIPMLQKAMELEPRSSGLVWVEIGRAYRLNNQPEQAMKSFQKAIALGEAKSAVYYQLAIVAKKAGDPEQSRQALKISEQLRAEEQHSR